MQLANCKHSEGFLMRRNEDNTETEVLTPGHDCVYVDKRNSFIGLADRLSGGDSRKFTAFMDRLNAGEVI